MYNNNNNEIIIAEVCNSELHSNRVSVRLFGTGVFSSVGGPAPCFRS